MLERLNEKFFSWFMLAIIIICFIPIYLYAYYTVPLADDFCMAGPSYRAWIETGSMWQVIAVAWKESVYQYMTWAGEYICMFLQALPIGLGDYRLYFLSSWVIVSIFIFSVYYAGKVFLKDYLKASTQKSFIITSILLLYMVTFLPEVYDAFYWYTTSVSYTLSFAVKLMLVAGIFKSLFVTEKVSKTKIVLFILLAFASAGFECSFSQTSFFLVMSAFMVISFCKKRKKQLAVMYWIATTVGWGVALLAPGNMARQNSNYGGTTGVVSVIWESLHRGIDGISDNMNIVLLLVTLLILPITYRIVKEYEGEFRLPGLLSLYSIAVYASIYAPWVFSRGIEAPSPYGGDSGYVRNVFWMTFVLLWFINIIYWTGWFTKTFRVKLREEKVERRISINVVYYGVLLLLLSFWSVKLEHIMEYTSPRLLWHIANGNAKAYYTAMEGREELLLDNPEEVIIVPKIEMPIPTRGAGDISADETYWVNEGVKAYYKLKYGVKTEE